MEGSKRPCLLHNFTVLQLAFFITGNNCIISSVFIIVKHKYYEPLKKAKIETPCRTSNILKKEK